MQNFATFGWLLRQQVLLSGKFKWHHYIARPRK